MPVTVNLPSVLAAHTGGARTIQATGRTLGEAVADVAARYPALAPRLRDEQGQPYPFVNFYLNDEDVRFRGGFAAPVQDGDEVTVPLARKWIVILLRRGGAWAGGNRCAPAGSRR